MKISLLIKREPFPEIFEETMSRHLSAISGANVSVTWKKRSVRDRFIRVNDKNLWLCNSLINTIFHSSANKEVMALPQRWYGRSRSLVRTVLQKIYISSAISPLSRAMVADHCVKIEPCYLDCSYCAIAGGNTRIRLFDLKAREATTILKSRFDSTYVSNDLAIRRDYPWLPALPVLRVLDEGRAYVEPIVSCPTASTLPDNQALDAAVSYILKACDRLAKETLKKSPVSAFTRELLQSCRAFEPELGQRDQALLCILQNWLQFVEAEALNLETTLKYSVDTGYSHGDLALGNILIDGTNVYLIDWERASRRIVGYDAITYAISSRSQLSGIWDRARALASGDRHTGSADRFARDALAVGSSKQTELQIMFYLTEELLFHLQESFQGPISVITPGLRYILTELEK